MSTCLNAYVKHPGFFNADLVATSVSHPREAAFVGAHLRGSGLDSILTVARAVMEGVHLRSAE